MKKAERMIDQAKKFAEYYRSEYNDGRHVIATLGSFGYTFNDDIKELLTALNEIGETVIVNKIQEALGW